MKSTVAAVIAAARQVPRRRLAAIATVAVILVAIAVWVPLPSAVQMRDWASGAGPWLPLVFLAAQIVVTVFPFPRTAFTLAAGLMFGSVLGAGLAVLASTLSAVIALLLVRAAGWQLNRLVSHPAVETLDSRLQRRGWPAIVSLRLIPAVPFAVVNYAAGASAVRLLPYTVATFVGLLPGTLAVVVFGDALTGHVSPLLVGFSALTAGVGIGGLMLELRAHRRTARRQCDDAGSGGLAVSTAKIAANDVAPAAAGPRSRART